MSTQPRWLTPHEQQVWRLFLDATNMLREHMDRELQRDSAMPQTYYQVLVNLSEAAQRTMRMSELAAACRSSRSKLSHAVARMEASGWIVRSGCPTDKRGSFAHLTDTGLAAIEVAAPGHVQVVREQFFDVLDEQQVRALGEICAAIKAGLAPRCSQVAAAEDTTESG
ncbi:MAG: MarR family winged helix-turn-helix transcriptional regulator [Sciscionella sp.]